MTTTIYAVGNIDGGIVSEVVQGKKFVSVSVSDNVTGKVLDTFYFTDADKAVQFAEEAAV